MTPKNKNRVERINLLHNSGLSILAISKITGSHHSIIRKVLEIGKNKKNSQLNGEVRSFPAILSEKKEWLEKVLYLTPEISTKTILVILEIEGTKVSVTTLRRAITIIKAENPILSIPYGLRRISEDDAKSYALTQLKHYRRKTNNDI